MSIEHTNPKTANPKSVSTHWAATYNKPSVVDNEQLCSVRDQNIHFREKLFPFTPDLIVHNVSSHTQPSLTDPGSVPTPQMQFCHDNWEVWSRYEIQEYANYSLYLSFKGYLNIMGEPTIFTYLYSQKIDNILTILSVTRTLTPSLLKGVLSNIGKYEQD